MPTDHGFRRLRCAQNRTSADACDRTAGPVWSAVGAGLHLLSLAFAGTVDHASLSGMTDDQKTPAAADPQVRELAEIPAVEVITRSAVMLMSAAAEKLGLASEDPDESPHRDLDEARRLITALAGLVTASAEFLGLHAGPLRDGLKGLQLAFREASAAPEEPGKGPGEKYTGPVW
ncbi:RecA/RadA [Mycolicibacterium canariasense]|uniref:RecA/RadA n=2 Tax=Mycolicibacterium canariasense TaxID=228230 RepID=A0A100WHG7_MYCCR|nr:RecA/RadA [Mycolicibacterium canariasense]